MHEIMDTCSNNSSFRSSLQYESDRDILHSSSRSSGDTSYNDTNALMMGLLLREEGLHSDYTVPTSNLRRYISDRLGSDGSRRSGLPGSLSPPTDIVIENASKADPLQLTRSAKMDSNHEASFSEFLNLQEQSHQRRPIFNSATQRKYCGRYHNFQQYSQVPTEDETISLWDGNIPPKHQISGNSLIHEQTSSSNDTLFHVPLYSARSNGTLAPVEAIALRSPISDNSFFNNPSQYSGLLSISRPTTYSKQKETAHSWFCWWRNKVVSSSSPSHRRKRRLLSSSPHNKCDHSSKGVLSTVQSDTRHAQALVLGCAFAAVWSGCNVTAPNLTSMANDYGFLTEASRDWYLGSVLAIVQTIASLPIAAAVGMLTDIVPSRQKLFVAILITGGLSSALGALSSSSYQSLVLSRWLSGGCMAGSVPVAFSLLSDWFDATERNTASSGLTAMMGLGIVGGQVYAGISTKSAMPSKSDWTHAFVASAIVQAIFAVFCMFFVHEPIRGGREVALQALMEKHGNSAYDRPLTWSTLRHAIWNNASNAILMWQGFFSSIPWGVMFVFLNDYLSQERGFTVPDATFLVAVFGIGCAAGGIIGGYIGQAIMHQYNRSLLPLFMAISTMVGIFPFVWLLNSNFSNARGIEGVSLAGMGGLIASLPSVLVRPCILNVNPPESRGAAMTTANLLVQLGRGIGPSCITFIQTIGNYFLANYDATASSMGTITVASVDRKFAFNVTLIIFWIISALQLLFLMKTLPRDQDSMEADLASYATLKAIALSKNTSDDELTSPRPSSPSIDTGGNAADKGTPTSSESVLPLLVSIQERINSFDNVAAQQTLQYVRAGIQEIHFSPFHCSIVNGGDGSSSPSSNEEDEGMHSLKSDHSKDTGAYIRRSYDQESTIPLMAETNRDSVGADNSQWTDETLLSQPQGLSIGSANICTEQRQSTEATPLLAPKHSP